MFLGLSKVSPPIDASIDGEFIYCEDGITWWLSDDKTCLLGLDDAFFEALDENASYT